MDGYLIIDNNLFRCINCYRFDNDMRFHRCGGVCVQCIEESEGQFACRICDREIKSSSNSLFFVQNIIPKELECPYKAVGCKWSGSMFEYAYHATFCPIKLQFSQYQIISIDQLTPKSNGLFNITYGKMWMYLGDIKDGKRHGQGKEYKNGLCYNGDWLIDEQTGHGTISYEDRSSYVGQVKKGMRHGKGKFLSVRGELYDGDWVNDYREGNGIFSNSKGHVIRAQWKNDKKNGKGVIIQSGNIFSAIWKDDQIISRGGTVYYPNGDKYEGEVNDVMLKVGKGRMEYANKTYYEGDWKDDMKHGVGKTNRYFGNYTEGEFALNDIVTIFKVEFDKNERFEGNYSALHGKGEGTLYYAYGRYEGQLGNNFKKEGAGKLILNNGDEFKGNFTNDRKEGRGIYKYSNGDYYDGMWKNDIYHGKGKFYYAADKSTYVGEFEEGLKQGEGKLTHSNGDFYIGTWYKNKKSGKGTYKKGELKYEGAFKADYFEGYGSLSLNDKTVFAGDFINGQFDGQGSYYFENGDKYYGSFVDGKMNGKGKYYYKTGDVYTGNFKNDSFDGPGKYQFAKQNAYAGDFKQGMFWGKGAFFYTQKGFKYEANWRSDAPIRHEIKMTKFDPKSNYL